MEQSDTILSISLSLYVNKIEIFDYKTLTLFKWLGQNRDQNELENDICFLGPMITSIRNG